MNIQLTTTAPKPRWLSSHRPKLIVTHLFFHLPGSPSASDWSGRLAQASLITSCVLQDKHQPVKEGAYTHHRVSLNGLITPAMKQPWLLLGDAWRFDPPALRPEHTLSAPQWEVRLWLENFPLQPEESVTVELMTDAMLVKTGAD